MTATSLALLARSPRLIASTRNCQPIGILTHRVFLFDRTLTPLRRVEDSSPSAVVDRLARIESMLEQQNQRLTLIGNLSPRVESPHGPSGYFPGLLQQPEDIQSSGNRVSETESTQFLIPKDHATIASTLLSLPKARRLLGEYPKDFFHQLEEKLPLPGLLDDIHCATNALPLLNPAILDELAGNYFDRVHPHQPLFTRQSFRLWQERLLETRATDEIYTAICLCVYALGTICISSGKTTDDIALGLGYFQPAFRIILHRAIWSFRPNILICQALLLASSYFSHLGRPLQSWKMSYHASHAFLHLAERYVGNLEHEDFH